MCSRLQTTSKCDSLKTRKKTSLQLRRAVTMLSSLQKISGMKITAAKTMRMKRVRTRLKKNVHTLPRETSQTNKISKNKKTKILCSTTVTQKWSTLNSGPGRFLSSKHSLKITSIRMVKILLMKWRMKVYRCLWNYASKILKIYLSVRQQIMVCLAMIQYQAIWSQHSPLSEAIV
jgi:hypothetical protein